MDDRKFRNAMGNFATGITVVTTETDGEVHGMTANAFMSVSLDPKLIVVSVSDKARILPKLKESKKFAVNILSSDQQEMSMIFAGQIKDKEEDVIFERLNGQAVLPGSLVQIACEVSAEHVEGDHTLFIGKVTDIELAEEGNPLVFFKGAYRTLAEEEK